MLPNIYADFSTLLQTLTHALYHLATNPEYLAVLREESDAIIETDGWTRSGMQKMKKLDSFFRESSRMNAALLSMSSLYLCLLFS